MNLQPGPTPARLIDLLDQGARLAPDRPCLVDDERSLRYREVCELTHRLAHRLFHAGIGPGSLVATYAQNSVLAFAAVLAILRSGAAWVPLHGRNPAAENARFVADNHCDALLFSQRHAQDAAALADEVGGLKLQRCIDALEGMQPSLLAWAAGAPQAAWEANTEPEDIAIVKGTGGTTGRPKSVMVSHRAMLTMAATFHRLMPHRGIPVNLMAAPMTHGAGNIAMAMLGMGATIRILDRADPQRVLQAIERDRVTTLFLPPTVIYSLLAREDAGERDYGSLQYFIYSAAPISADKLHEAVRVFGPVMTQAYGQTEAPLLCTFMSPADHDVDDEEALQRRLRSCGRATPFTQVEVMDDQGRLLGPQEVGEIVIRGDLVMSGYRGAPEETAEVSRFGWHHTGDVGYRDRDGWFYIVDRKKDMIISGGFNIFPSEIEQVLWSHPAVNDCAVVGVPDPYWGESARAIIELKPRHEATADQLLAFCRERLGGMKTPKSLEFWAELPRSAVGKVLKRDIRARFWAGQERQV